MAGKDIANLEELLVKKKNLDALLEQARTVSAKAELKLKEQQQKAKDEEDLDEEDEDADEELEEEEEEEEEILTTRAPVKKTEEWPIDLPHGSHGLPPNWPAEGKAEMLPEQQKPSAKPKLPAHVPPTKPPQQKAPKSGADHTELPTPQETPKTHKASHPSPPPPPPVKDLRKPLPKEPAHGATHDADFHARLPEVAKDLHKQMPPKGPPNHAKELMEALEALELLSPDKGSTDHHHTPQSQLNDFRSWDEEWRRQMAQGHPGQWSSQSPYSHVPYQSSYAQPKAEYPWMHAQHKLQQKTALEKLQGNPQLQFGLVVGAIVFVMLLIENFRRIRRAFLNAPKHKLQLLAWAVFLPLFVICNLAQPTQEDPSHLITFAAGVQLFGFVLLWILPRKPCEPGSQGGDSAEFALLTVVSLVVRLVCTWRFRGYLPTDPTGDGCYQMMELLCAVIALRGLVRLGLTPRQAASAAGTAVGALLLACECHGTLDAYWLADTAWASSVYMEAMAWYFMLRNLLQAGPARRVDSSFLAPCFMQSLLRCVFWWLAADEVRGEGAALFFPDALVGVHCLVCASLGLTSLLVYLAVDVQELPFTVGDKVIDKTVEMSKVAGKAEPLLSSASAVFGEGESAKTTRRKQVDEDALGPLSRAGVVPVRAVLVDGKMHIEYKAS